MSPLDLSMISTLLEGTSTGSLHHYDVVRDCVVLVPTKTKDQQKKSHRDLCYVTSIAPVEFDSCVFNHVSVVFTVNQ